MVKTYPKLYLAIPLLNEYENIAKLLEIIYMQTFSNFDIYVCVNQFESWWSDPLKREICENNQATIKLLKDYNSIKINILDKCSEGKGWKEKKGGVGWARKVIMDEICRVAKPDDIILSLDGDTTFNAGYFEAIAKALSTKQKYTALSVPYYHKLVEKDSIDRAILRYEIYMRYYSINMWRICSPYSYTALGSAIAIPVWAYKAVSGITPRTNGEDFYLLQKLKKFGTILHWCEEKVYPAARVSERVGFGTGPAIKMGMQGKWEGYPIYDHRLFNNIKSTYDMFEELFKSDIITPLSEFLRKQFNDKDIWGPLRKNNVDIDHFVRACHEKLDGLRILQYLRSEQKKIERSDEELLIDFFHTYYDEDEVGLYIDDLASYSFNNIDISALNDLRNFLMDKENGYRKLTVL